MPKVNIEIEVEINGPVKGKPEDYTFVNLTVTSVDGQSIPLPADGKTPAPRRLIKDLALAAANEYLGIKKPADPNAPPDKPAGA